MKKVYQVPEIEISKLLAEDILSGSNGNTGSGGDLGGNDGFEWN